MARRPVATAGIARRVAGATVGERRHGERGGLHGDGSRPDRSDSAGSGRRPAARAAPTATGARAAHAAAPGERPRRERPSREHHARRGPRRATPGSTSYDEAAEPLDPDWDGGAWYGPSSGTYWTINPREYADPRKHGPEYQARARRATQGPADGAVDGADRRRPEPAIGKAAASEASAGAEPSWQWSADERADAGPADSTTSGGAEWGTRSWHYDDVPPDAAPGGRRARSGHGASSDATLPDLESLAMRASPRNLLALARARRPLEARARGLRLAADRLRGRHAPHRAHRMRGVLGLVPRARAGR